MNEIVRITSAFAAVGEGRKADANRATANAELVRERIREAEGDVSAAAARVSQLLFIDTSVTVRNGGPIDLVRLVNENAETESLVAAAIRSRPEIFARSSEIQEAQTRVRQERIRPCLPLVAIGYSAGVFGGGSNEATDNEFGPLKGRLAETFLVIAVWNIQNLGMGNAARAYWATAVVGQATAEYQRPSIKSAARLPKLKLFARPRRRKSTSCQVLNSAEEGFRLETDRIQQGQGRPIEALDSFRQLLDARQELLRAIVGFDTAQFRLFVALGNNPAARSDSNCRGTDRDFIVAGKEAEPNR